MSTTQQATKTSTARGELHFERLQINGLPAQYALNIVAHVMRPAIKNSFEVGRGLAVMAGNLQGQHSTFRRTHDLVHSWAAWKTAIHAVKRAAELNNARLTGTVAHIATTCPPKEVEHWRLSDFYWRVTQLAQDYAVGWLREYEHAEGTITPVALQTNRCASALAEVVLREAVPAARCIYRNLPEALRNEAKDCIEAMLNHVLTLADRACGLLAVGSLERRRWRRDYVGYSDILWFLVRDLAAVLACFAMRVDKTKPEGAALSRAAEEGIRDLDSALSGVDYLRCVGPRCAGLYGRARSKVVAFALKWQTPEAVFAPLLSPR